MTIEVELKALAPNFDVRVLQDNYTKRSIEAQLNHYFNTNKVDVESLDTILEVLSILIPNYAEFNELRSALKAPEISVRTRQVNGEEVYLVVKVKRSGSAANGTARQEVQQKLDISLEYLDRLLLNHGFTCASKWSRYREEYESNDCNFKHLICVDQNAGYGQLVEIEATTEDETEVEALKYKLYAVLKTLNLEELDEHLLEDMFAFYQKHWQDYYGTNKLIWDDPRWLAIWQKDNVNLVELG